MCLPRRREQRMMEMRFVQFSDVHLYASLTESRLGLPEEKRQKRRRDVRQVVARACFLAKERKCHAVLIPGDLFDDETADWDTVRFLIDTFGSIAPLSVFITPGNHDPCLPQSPYNADFLAEKDIGKWPENVHIFSSNAFQTFPLDGREDVAVTGIANIGQELEQQRILATKTALPDATVNILMFHGSREPLPPGKEATFPFSDAELLSQEFDYAAIGHYHTYAEIKDGQGSVRGAYSGTPASQRLSEVGEKFVLLGEIAEQRTVNLEKIPLDRRTLHSIEVNCSGLSHREAVIRKIEEEAGKTSNNRDDILFIRLVGRFPRGESFQLPPDLLADKYFHAVVDAGGLRPDYDFKKYVGESERIRTVEDEFRNELREMWNKAHDKNEKRVVEAAFYYGMDALLEGKLCGRYED